MSEGPQNEARAKLLVPGEERSNADAFHPVHRNKQRVPTPSLNWAYGLFKQLIHSPEFAICFYCEPRNGKTTTTEIFATLVELEMLNVPIVRISAGQHPPEDRRGQWASALEDQKLEAKGTVANVLSDWINLLIASAVAQQSDTLVLIIDEAQNWLEREWDNLKRVVNAVALRSGVRTLTVSFGQMELLDRRKALIKRTDLIDRFFAQIYELPGVKNVKQLTKIFEQYDDPKICHYPMDSGISYAEFLMPKAYANGWRLKEEMPEMWKAFKATGKTFRYVKAAAAFGTVAQFFKQNKDADSSTFKGSPKLWAAAVKASPFLYLHRD